ncbi:hypothetical protein DPM12_19430, partial [Phytoactinopolyspora halophila]
MTRHQHDGYPASIHADDRPVMIVLSAHDHDRLEAQARELREALDRRGVTDEHLADIAYTLQIGREEMEYRLGVLAGSVDELKDKLAHAFDDGARAPEVYLGHGRGVEAELDGTSVSDQMGLVTQLVASRDYGRVLELWTKGMRIDWHALYSSPKPGTVSLPAYPFSGERYWAPDEAGLVSGGDGVSVSGGVGVSEGVSGVGVSG